MKTSLELSYNIFYRFANTLRKLDKRLYPQRGKAWHETVNRMHNRYVK